MKKIIAFLLVGFCLTAMVNRADAQVAMTNPNGAALDTATQAAAEACYKVMSTNKKQVSIVLKTTKISGTIAGTVKWQGSLDGTEYVTLSSDTLVDASTNYTVKFTDNGYIYYRALITQTGTSSLSYAGKIFGAGRQ